jgi:hypothetical protein
LALEHLYSEPRVTVTYKEILHFYNVVEEYQDEEDPRNVQIPKIEGERTVEGPKIESIVYEKPLKT